MRLSRLLPAALLLLSLAPAAGAAVDPCDPGLMGNRVCAERSGVCASVGYTPPFTDFFAGAAHCPLVHAGPDGATACDAAWAGYVTRAGFTGFDGGACVVMYEDSAGRTCLEASARSNLFEQPAIRPVCA